MAEHVLLQPCGELLQTAAQQERILNHAQPPYIGSQELAFAALLDPFGLDGALDEFAQSNLRGDWSFAMKRLHAIGDIANHDGLEGFTVEEAAAAMRDTDMLASAAKHLGVPMVVRQVPGLEKAFLDLAEILGQSVPRGTIATYLAQEEGERLRLFSGSPAERVFVAELKKSYAAMDNTLEQLSDIDFAENDTDALLLALWYATDAFGVMKQSQTIVNEQLPSDYFNKHIQPFFPPLTVNRKTYFAAGAAQLPMLAVECMLWGLENNGNNYSKHFKEALPYLTARQKMLLESFLNANDTSVAGFIRTIDPKRFPDQFRALNNALIDAFNMASKWRGSHYGKVAESFTDDMRNVVGSMNGTPGMLRGIIEEVRASVADLKRARRSDAAQGLGRAAVEPSHRRLVVV